MKYPSFYRDKASVLALLLTASILALLSCTAMKPNSSDTQQAHLAPCPASPNCVSSDADDAAHRVEPYRLKLEPRQAWKILQEVVSAQPRTTIVSVTESYLHAESRSLLLRFVDDVEFHLRANENIIAVRSAARLGYYDFGVNRKRVEQLRQALRSCGAIE